MNQQVSFPAKGLIRAHCANAAETVLHAIFSESMWFEVTPEPDDVWLFVTKGEADKLLHDKLASLNDVPVERIVCVCRSCGSPRCSKDATVDANDHEQVKGVFDNAWCDDCGAENKSLDEVAVPATFDMDLDFAPGYKTAQLSEASR